MVCSMIKKGVLGAALGAGALYLAFGTSAPSYVRTAFHKVRHDIKATVPDPFEVERAREVIANLEPAIIDNRETLARAEVEVEYLQREIAATRKNLENEKRDILSLRDRVKSGDFRLAGNISVTENELRSEITGRWDHYRHATSRLEDQEATLKARQKAVVAAREKLGQLVTEKKNLMAKVEAIDAKLKLIEATQAKNEFHFDGTALAHAKKTVAELEKRLEIKAKYADIEGRYSETGLPILEPGRDVLKEIDSEFNAPVKTSSDKSL